MERYRTGSHSRYDIKFHFVWVTRYFVASSGNVTDEVIMEYIRQQDGTEPDDAGDNFRVTKA